MNEKLPRVVAIAAIGKRRELGFANGDLVWRLSADLKRFRELTTGNAVIMGRKTFESIGKPLPKRVTVVVTRAQDFVHDGCVVVHSVEEAIEVARCAGVEKIFIGGGGEIYKAALSCTSFLELTHINTEEPRADVFFPPYENEFQQTWRSGPQRENTIEFYWASYKRKRPPRVASERA